MGQGYEGGLAALVASFGGEVEEEAPPSPAPLNPDIVAAPEPPPPSAPSTIPASTSASAAAAEPAWVFGPRLDGPPVSYKVLSHKDKFFGDRFDPDKVGEAIAAYAAMGWQPVGAATDRLGGDRTAFWWSWSGLN